MRIEPIKFDINITKDKVVNISRIFSIIIIFALYILGDFINASMRGAFTTDLAYWITTMISLVLVTTIMIITRSMRRDSLILQSIDICFYNNQITRGFKKITTCGLSAALEDYLEKVNEDNKYNTFIKQTQQALIKLKNKDKNIERRRQLNALLELPKEEILKFNINYKKITFSKLFAAIDGRIANDNEYDLDTYEKSDVFKMVGTKSLMIFLFSAFSATIVADFFISGWSALFSVFIKIFTLFMAINTAMNSAGDYVEHSLKVSIYRRFRILSEFAKNEPLLSSVLEDKNNSTN